MLNDPINKTSPHNPEAEAGVLGGVLLDNKALNECLSIIAPDDFYSTANRIIFESMCRVTDLGKPIDSIVLSDFLRERGELDKIGGSAHLATLLDNTGSSANVTHYARIIKDKAVLRAIAAAGAGMMKDAYTGNTDPASVLDNAQKSLMEISVDRNKNDLQDSREICKSTFRAIEERYKNGTSITGLSTGFSNLDTWTSGFHNSELIIIAGRPGMGKTALGVNIAEHVVLSGKPVAVFSLEMSRESLMTRIFASQTGIDSRRLRRGSIFDSDWKRLIQVVDQVSKTPLFIDDSSTLTPMQLKAKARRLKVNKGLSLIIVDYLQLMTVSGRHETREREIAEISRSLKALAKELHIPVIALSQLNRDLEKRNDKRPGLSDLRESGAIEQDADVILFLYRDEVYNQSEDNPEKGLAEIIIGKQRNGPTGKVTVRFDEKTTRFSDRGEGQSI